MSAHADPIRFSWLAALLGEQRHRVTHLMSRMRGLLSHGTLPSLTPKSFRKFMMMLDEVAEAQNAETQILNRIDAMEAKHRRLRHQRKLLRARVEARRGPQAEPQADLTPAKTAQRPKDGLLWFLAFWHLFLKDGNVPKKQQLALD